VYLKAIRRLHFYASCDPTNLRRTFDAQMVWPSLNKTNRALWLQPVAVLGAIGIMVALWSIFPVPELLELIQQRVMRWGVWSAICYPILYACCNVLLLPGGVLSIGGGFFFGLWWGFLIVLIGNVAGAAISFFIGRTVGRRWLEHRLEKSRRLHALEPAVEREGWKLILLSQLHPLFPSSLMNYLYGLTKIRFRTCMVWIAIGQAPGLFLYAYLGTLGQLGLRLARGETHPRVYEYWIWAAGLLVSLAMLLLSIERAFASLCSVLKVRRRSSFEMQIRRGICWR
jgi:uncharacterized membrane protein YdjX (TVP38/TMEM64 family)